MAGKPQKNLAYSVLLDFYGAVLTDKQRAILTEYYDEDLSLAEISEELSISRAGALDHIRRATKTLYDYEERLHLLQQSEKIKEILTLLRQHVDEEGASYINKLEDLLS